MTVDTVAVFSDIHSGSTLGLCPPSFELDDGGSYVASKAQAWLWYHWLAYWKLVEETHRKNGGKLYVVSNGDMIDGDHHDTPQIITRNMADQRRIAEACLEPALKMNPEHIFVIRGTETHVGSAGQNEEEVARNIGAEPDPETNKHSWYRLKINVRGVKIDVAHHGKAGGKHWTKLNSAISDATDIVLQYIEDGERIPDVIVRSHTHKPIDTYDNYKVRLLGLPSFQVSTAFGHKIASGRVLPIGAYVLSCGDGKFTVDKHVERPLQQATWRCDK